MKTAREILFRIWRGIIIRTDVFVLRGPYSRCKYVAIERYGDCICRGELLSRSFESLCQELEIEIPLYQNRRTASKFCQWYMAHRLSWITARSILVGKNSHSFNDLPAPRCLYLAKEYIVRDLEASKYWAKYLSEITKQSPERLETKTTTVNEIIPPPKPPKRAKQSVIATTPHRAHVVNSPQLPKMVMMSASTIPSTKATEEQQKVSLTEVAGAVIDYSF